MLPGEKRKPGNRDNNLNLETGKLGNRENQSETGRTTWTGDPGETHQTGKLGVCTKPTHWPINEYWTLSGGANAKVFRLPNGSQPFSFGLRFVDHFLTMFPQPGGLEITLKFIRFRACVLTIKNNTNWNEDHVSVTQSIQISTLKAPECDCLNWMRYYRLYILYL